MDALATPDDLLLPFDMDDGEKREAQRALDELSDDARYYGKPEWEDADSAPRQVIRLVCKAAARHMKNYDGFQTSRAGDESVTWFERKEGMGDAQFTTDEKKRLGELAGRYLSNGGSVGFYAYSKRSTPRFPREEFVPTDTPGERPFPFGDPEDPWGQ